MIPPLPGWVLMTILIFSSKLIHCAHNGHQGALSVHPWPVIPMPGSLSQIQAQQGMPSLWVAGLLLSVRVPNHRNFPAGALVLVFIKFF